MNTTAYPNDNFGLPPELTPHNPDNLTREQVGKDYRLLATTEIWERPMPSDHISVYLSFGKIWDMGSSFGSSEKFTYRVPINHPLDPDPSLKQPEWKLPDPPVGHKWHRDDWTQDMLPDGYRPLLECEIDNKEHSDIDWRSEDAVGFCEPIDAFFANGVGWFRTKRPLPTQDQDPLCVGPCYAAWQPLPKHLAAPQNGNSRLRTLITDLVNNATTAQDLHLAAQLVGVLAENLFSED